MSKKIYFISLPLLFFVLLFSAMPAFAQDSDHSAAQDSSEAALAGQPSDSAEISTGAPAPPADSDGVSAGNSGSDSSEVAAAAPKPQEDTSPVSEQEMLKDLKKLFAGNRKIYFLEQMAALKLSNGEGSEVEPVLNSLYSVREGLAMKLAGLAVRDSSGKALKMIKGQILNNRLYELYGLDSLPRYALGHPQAPDGADGTSSVSASGSDRLRDAMLEIRSYIELENSRLTNSSAFISEIDSFMASLKPESPASGGDASEGGPAGHDGGFSQAGSKVLFAVQDVSPGANSSDAPIDAPVTVKFDAGRLAGLKGRTVVDVKKVALGQKYSKPSAGDTGNVKFKWDPAGILLTITAGAHLERNALYNVLLEMEHKISSAPPAGAGEGAEVPRRGFFRDRSVNGGLFKTVDVDFAAGKVSYRFDWNFKTLAYTSTSSEAALSPAETPATEENEIAGATTAEVEMKDGRDTGENEIGDKAPVDTKNGTAENSVNKKEASMAGEFFEQPKDMPMIVGRSPEGVSIMSDSGIFVIFSCDVDPKSITNDTMQLYRESPAGFERLEYKLKLDGRRLTLTPKAPLASSKNHRVVVTTIRTASKLVMPINETFYFRTACAVLGAKFSRDGGQKASSKAKTKEETIEITLSENPEGVSFNFFEISGKKEVPVECDRVGTVAVQPAMPSAPPIGAMTLGGGGPAAAPGTEKAPPSAPAKSAVAGKSVRHEGPVTFLLKPRSPLVKGRDYKIDAFAPGGVIENGIIRFTAK